MAEECPICDTPLDTKRDVEDGHRLLEEYSTCPNGCFYYEFAYGSTRQDYMIRGQRITFYGHYTVSEGQSLRFFTGQVEAIVLVRELAREVYLEDLARANKVLKEYEENHRG